MDIEDFIKIIEESFLEFDFDISIIKSYSNYNDDYSLVFDISMLDKLKIDIIINIINYFLPDFMILQYGKELKSISKKGETKYICLWWKYIEN